MKISIIGLSGNSLFFYNKKLIHQEVGGKGYNQAIACIRNNIEVSYLSAIGNDEAGNLCENYMKNEGINSFFVRKNKPTVEAKIYVEENGDNDVTFENQDPAVLDIIDVMTFGEEIKGSDYLLLQFEVPKEVNEYAIKIAKENNVKIIINPAPIKFEIEAIKDADIITPNKNEAIHLFGLNKNDSIEDLIRVEQEYLKDKNMIIINTLGDKGIICIKDKQVIKEEAIKVDAIDTTGAGDTFNGFFISEFIKSGDFLQSIKLGILASGKEVQKRYVMDAIPKRNELF